MKWYLEVLKKYAVFGGRARRREYWTFFLFNFIIAFVVAFAEEYEPSIIGTIGALYYLAVLIPTVAVGVRRMHDTDFGGWFLLLPGVNLALLFVRGTRGDNRFGPDPRANTP